MIAALQTIKHSLRALVLIAPFCALGAFSSEEDGVNPDKNTIFDLSRIKTTCINFDGVDIQDKTRVSDCKVSEFGTFATFNNKPYYYALYCLLPHYDGIEDGKCDSASLGSRRHIPSAIAIFTGASNPRQVKLLLRDTADLDSSPNSYEKPELISNRFGDILYVPIQVQGTGSFNVSKYLQMNPKNNEWEALDADTWIQELAIPKGLSIGKGVWPDLKSMSAEIYLYKNSDANCCPTGGTLHVNLAIEHNKITTKSAVYNAAEAVKH